MNITNRLTYPVNHILDFYGIRNLQTKFQTSIFGLAVEKGNIPINVAGRRTDSLNYIVALLLRRYNSKYIVVDESYAMGKVHFVVL